MGCRVHCMAEWESPEHFKISMVFRNSFVVFSILCLCLFAACGGVIKTGEQAWQYKRYAKGVVMLRDEFNKEKNQDKKARLAFLMGDSYLNMGQFSNSISWFKKAIDLGYANVALEKYAFALKQNEDYEDAIRAFTILAEETGLASVYRREISICKLALEWKKQASRNKSDRVFPLETINEPNSNEFSGQFLPDGKFLFTSDRLGATGAEKYDWSGHFYFDLFICDFKESKIQPLGNHLNTMSNEGASCVGPSGDVIYFTRCEVESDLNAYCQIYFGGLKGSDPAEWIDLGCRACNDVQPAVHRSDTVMVFSSDREGGLGSFDLYYSVKRGGYWSTPVNLGSGLNTQGNEKFPVWNRDTLYFSSDYLPGMGGLDIFKTWIDRSGNWVSPQNVLAPVNSGGDDFSLSFDPTAVNDTILSRAVFSSNRDQASGDQLYQWFRYLIREEEAVPVSSKKGRVSYFLNLAFQSQEGYYDAAGNQRLDSILIRNSSSTWNYFTGTSSSMFVEVPSDTVLNFQVSRKGYWNTTWEYIVPAIEQFAERDTIVVINAKVNLTPIIYDKPFVLEDVYFDFDKWEIKESSFRVLDEIVRFLNTNSTLKVSIQSHTDCRGEDAYNMQLSERRAFSVFQYLVSKGVSAERLSYKGMGERALAIRCPCLECSEEEHLKNRRSTFTISR